jgi:hypothetical protein
MFTTTRTAQVHVIGRCPVRGCPTRPARRTLDGRVETDRTVVRTAWAVPTESGPMSPVPTLGGPNATITTYLELAERMYGTGWRSAPHRHLVEAMDALGWTCDVHDRLARLVAVEGVYSEDTGCNDACETAVGPLCVCYCAGANHGIAYA